MKDMVSLFREYARLDLIRMGPGLSVTEFESWMRIKSILDQQLPTRSGSFRHERRSAKRIPTHLRCSYSSSDEFRNAGVTQLSTGGVFISTLSPLPIGSDMVLRIVLEDSGAEIEVAGVVVSNNVDGDLMPGARGMGVRFSMVKPEMIDAISDLYAQELGREHQAAPAPRDSPEEAAA